jgi:catechol 2,3-dioxygenase-like lactoylglutathione lyase family enzyme
MVRTRGLTHLALRVRDVERTFRFYRDLLGVVEVYRGERFIQAQTPGSWDVLVFEEDADHVTGSGGILHFGFRLQRPEDIEEAVATIAHAGGVVTGTGQFVPGEPYVFFRDPDGYEVELWYEIPTPVDPPDTMTESAEVRP